MVDRNITMRAHRRGVMLADVLVSVVLLGVALAVLLGMSGRALIAQKNGEQLQIAAMLLDEQLQLIVARGPDNYAKEFPMEGPCEAPYESFRYELQIEGGTGGGAYEVVATVSWFASGRTQSETVHTRIAPRLGEEPDPERTPSETVDRLE
jgi:Tfp pilus assembly protein PilV